MQYQPCQIPEIILNIPIHSWWQQAYFIATFIIALIAVSGFIYSAITSKKLSSLFEKSSKNHSDIEKSISLLQKSISLLQEGIDVYTKPSVDLRNIDTFSPPNDDSIVGLALNLINSGKTHVKVTSIDVDGKVGQEPFPRPNATGDHPEQGAFMLRPEQVYQLQLIRAECFKKHLTPRPYGPEMWAEPHVVIEINVEFQTLSDTPIKYKYYNKTLVSNVPEMNRGQNYIVGKSLDSSIERL